MTKHSRVIAGFLSGLVAIVGVAILASFAFADDGDGDGRSVDGTIWVANRGAHTIRGFDARTGDVVATVNMAAASQPGDLAFARGKLYVAEERGTSPAIAVVEPASGVVLTRFFFGTSERPHHVHTSADGRLVAVGLYGTDKVAVVETKTDTLLGAWDTNPAEGQTSGRAHAGVFSPNGQKLYVASDATNEIIALDPRTGDIFWRLPVPGAHELVVTRDGKRAFVAQRTLNKVSVIDLANRTLTDALTLGSPDTLRLSANNKLLTIGLRTRPAQVAFVDTRTLPLEAEIVTIGGIGTIAGHQWTSPSGRYTFAAFEGPSTDTGNAGVAAIDHRAGNAVVQLPAYPGGTAGGPHGVDLEPEPDEDEDEDEDEDDE